MKTIGILTSSRADYGIYLPLLKTLKEDPDFNLKLIVFGTHLSPFHGYTLNQILEDGFKIDYKIESMLIGDTPNAISTAIALTTLKFADFWEDHKNEFDLVFCLGDRYEMLSSVIAGIPFGIPYAHLHGGEKTIGAIDNIFRHYITLASKYHFVSCEGHAKRVSELIESNDRIYNVGSLSLDNLKSLPLYSVSEFYNLFHIDFSRPTILVTVHPETINIENNQIYIDELIAVLNELTDYQILITLPNADTNNSIIRNKFLQLVNDQSNRVQCVENLGSKGYFSAMKYCSFLVGNSSSGIIEAASFNKWVINLGDRQKGRFHSSNVLNVQFNKKAIKNVIRKVEHSLFYPGENIYYKEDVSKIICSILKNIL